MSSAVGKRYERFGSRVELAGRGIVHTLTVPTRSKRLGSRVEVPLGTKVSTGFVVALIDEAPLDSTKVKPIKSLLDEDEPALTREIIDLCRWAAEYYIAPFGEMLRVALPANMAARGKREAVLVADDALIEIARDEKRILDSDLDIIAELRKRPLPLSMLSRSTIERLRGAGIIATRDRLVDAKGVRYDRFVILESAGGALTEKQQSAADLLQSRGGTRSTPFWPDSIRPARPSFAIRASSAIRSRRSRALSASSRRFSSKE